METSKGITLMYKCLKSNTLNLNCSLCTPFSGYRLVRYSIAKTLKKFMKVYEAERLQIFGLPIFYSSYIFS